MDEGLWSPRLVALDFSSLMEDATREFTGREWLLSDIDHWVEHGDDQIFMLTGEPGIGKTALAAKLIRRRADICAYHFCAAGRSETVVPHTVLRSLAAQMGQRVPGYGDALAGTIDPIHLSVRVEIDVGTMTGGEITGVVLERLMLADPQREFDVLIRAPLAALNPPRPAVVVLDALDEAFLFRGQPTLIDLIAQTPSLPWIRLFITTRPDRRILRHFRHASGYHLRSDDPRNQNELVEYVESSLRAALPASSPEVALIAQVSSGNFLHAKLLVEHVTAGRGRSLLTDPPQLPKTLNEAYADFLSRFDRHDWETRLVRLFGTLAVAEEPLCERQLSWFTGTPRTVLRQDLAAARQLLLVTATDGGDRFALFHQTLRDYLVDEHRNYDFWCAPEDAHRAIATFYVNELGNDPTALDKYAARHLGDHLVELGDWENLILLLQNEHFWLALGRELCSREPYGGGRPIQVLLTRYLATIPDAALAGTLKLTNLSGPEQYFVGRLSNFQTCNPFAFASCLNYYSVETLEREAAGKQTEYTSECHRCHGRVHYGLLDIGGPDYFEHAYSWCSTCFWSVFDYQHSDDINHEPLYFDRTTNLWTTVSPFES
ncbi:AAA family ATPase [Terrabacter sp. Soil810]|uniref:AAA family ATPase n=1 Tax=Terrabacter sp. Soil810 TaxID=1736418 RepID=UPI00070D520F|nr:ATP-binding protein [Terrabacter sp. Soil810]KRF42156.1 hypothetical protein ASG96_22385 [Terrabacter sp. Soil810]